MKVSKRLRGKASWLPLAAFAGLAAAVVCQPLSAQAAVVIFDGFGDADKNNNGVPLELVDVEVSSAGDGSVEPYTALGNDGSPLVFPMDTMVSEVTAVEDPNDVGIRWTSISGFTGAPSFDPRVAVHIIDDTAGNLPETNPSIGYNHSAVGGTRVAGAINSGLALAAEAKGRANQFAGFFDQTVSLGPEVGDEVKLSFDFRLWFSAPNLNTQQSINHIPAIGEIRFGLYQDTDNQLGMSHPEAGRPDENGQPTSAVWGQDNGNFRGDLGDIDAVGAQGDNGWFVRLPIDDPEVASFDKLPGGAGARINEEVNAGSPSDRRILNGASDFVARPDPDNPQFVNMDIDRVYNVSLSLRRFDDPGTPGNLGDTIYAEATVIDVVTLESWSFGNYERVDNAGTPDGFSSDSWDYFVMGLAGSTDSDDFDWLIDNFKVEVFGSNAPADESADFDNDGDVDGADFLIWQRGFGGAGQPPSAGDANGDGNVNAVDLAIWKAQFGPAGASAANVGAVPEPAAGLLALAALAAIAGRRRVTNVH